MKSIILVLLLCALQCAAETVKWEYGFLHRGYPKTFSVSWNSAGANVMVEDAENTDAELVRRLAEKGVVQAPDKDARPELLNALGEQGWELVLVEKTDAGGGRWLTTYTFKRRKP